MTSPVLSYKKPNAKSPVALPPPEINVSLASLEPETTQPKTRKVLSRRKALQEFYHIQQQRKQQEEANTTIDTTTEEVEPNRLRTESVSKKVNVDDPELLANYVKTTPIEEILSLRNSITSNLNSHDLEKKSIIYDNYYELIKLNQTLQNLSNPTSVDVAENSFTGLKNLDKPELKVDKNFIFDALNDLKNFLDNKASVYNDEFQNVIGKFDMQTSDVDSTSSVRAVVDETIVFLDSVDKKQLTKDINLLLSGNIEESKGPEIKKQLQEMKGKLDPSKDQLLILQLGSIEDNL